MEELISAIKIVKMYCWESAFLEKIIKFRRDEINNIKKRNYWGHITHRFLTSFGRLLTVAVVLVSMATLTVGEFKSADIFVAQQFIVDLNWNFGLLFWAVFLLKEATVSVGRLEELILADEKSIQCGVQLTDTKLTDTLPILKKNGLCYLISVQKNNRVYVT